MQIKIDEDLPNAAATFLAERGYDAITVRVQGMGGWKDDRLWTAVQSEGRFLITGDKGFTDLRRHPPGSHAGVLLLRPGRDGVGPLLDLLTLVLDSVDLEQLEGAVAVATPRGLRVRRGGEPRSYP